MRVSFAALCSSLYFLTVNFPLSIKSYGDRIMAIKLQKCCSIGKLIISQEERLLVASPMMYIWLWMQLVQGHQNKVMLLINVRTKTAAYCDRKVFQAPPGIFMCNSMHAFHVNGSCNVVSTVPRALELLSEKIDKITYLSTR